MGGARDRPTETDEQRSASPRAGAGDRGEVTSDAGARTKDMHRPADDRGVKEAPHGREDRKEAHGGKGELGRHTITDRVDPKTGKKIGTDDSYKEKGKDGKDHDHVVSRDMKGNERERQESWTKKDEKGNPYNHLEYYKKDDQTGQWKKTGSADTWKWHTKDGHEHTYRNFYNADGSKRGSAEIEKWKEGGKDHEKVTVRDSKGRIVPEDKGGKPEEKDKKNK
ncbi:hypothetical protein [Microbispora sp. KK1-11]|uniref:hypothetical protein n=1 Tax=Microbispora sp. KK1-11 TaxID=2053005 RepID=UPI001159D46F|nr:hypothetical protein [Microbispora sp. KK1-11]TQS25627.1 hypothetical protein FLW16_28945 [Microbispora sp. KK1-11]